MSNIISRAVRARRDADDSAPDRIVQVIELPDVVEELEPERGMTKAPAL